MNPGGGIPGSAPLGGLMGQRNQGGQASGATGMTEQQMIMFVCVRTAVLHRRQLTRMLQMQSAMESCPAKTTMAGVMGFALGGMFGLFMSSVRSRLKSSQHGSSR